MYIVESYRFLGYSANQGGGLLPQRRHDKFMQVHQEKKTAKFRISFIFLFIFASFAACFALYMRSDSDGAVPSVKTVEEEEEASPGESYEADGSAVKSVVNPVPSGKKADETYFDSAAFIVMNQLNGLADYKVVPKENMLSGDFLLEELSTETESFINGNSFENYYIMSGINDLDNTSAGLDGLKRLTDAIVEKNPDAGVYILSLMPVTAKSENDSVSNVKISAFNSELLEFANENGVHYLDLNTYFVGNDGKLPETKTESVGNRLKRDVYLEIGNYLLTHIADKKS